MGEATDFIGETGSKVICKTGIIATTQVPGVANTFGSAGLVRRGQLESLKEANDLSVWTETGKIIVMYIMLWYTVRNVMIAHITSQSVLSKPRWCGPPHNFTVMRGRQHNTLVVGDVTFQLEFAQIKYYENSNDFTSRKGYLRQAIAWGYRDLLPSRRQKEERARKHHSYVVVTLLSYITVYIFFGI